MLTDDAWLAMPPPPNEYHGRAAIRAFLQASTRWRAHRTLHLLATRTNTQPAFGCYLAEPGAHVAHPAGVVVLTLTDDRISTLARFLGDDIFRHLGLPDTL